MQLSELGQYHNALLEEHFKSSELTKREELRYSSFFNAEKCVHSWDMGEIEYPRTIILPNSALRNADELAKMASDHSDAAWNFSGVPSPMLHQLLVMPLILSLRPALFDARLEAPEALPLDRVSGSRQEKPEWKLTIPAVGDNGLEWQLFLDPALDFSVSRALAMKNGSRYLLIEISYDNSNKNVCLPVSWTVLVYGYHSTFIQQRASAQRTSFEASSNTDQQEALSPLIPLMAWVEDRIDDRCYLKLSEDTQFELSSGQIASATYEEAINLAQGETTRVQTLLNAIDVIERAKSLSQWPGVLLPLAVLVAAVGVLLRSKN